MAALVRLLCMQSTDFLLISVDRALIAYTTSLLFQITRIILHPSALRRKSGAFLPRCESAAPNIDSGPVLGFLGTAEIFKIACAFHLPSPEIFKIIE